MSTQKIDDADYPYASRPPAVLVVADFSPRAVRSWSGRVVWVWLARLLLAGGVLAAVMALPIAIVGIRVTRQARDVAALEELGCDVHYLSAAANDGMLGFLEETFGKNYFGEVYGVNAMGISQPDGPRTVCNICRRFDRLETFEISSDSFSFREMANWKQLDQLVMLHLHSSTITDEDLARIGRMPKLRSLHVSSPRITDAGLSHLGGMKELGMLTIESAQLNGTGPVNAKGFPDLGTLEILNSPRVIDQVILNLGPLPELVSLQLSGTQIGDPAVAHAVSGGKLSHVYLSETRITDAALASLAKCSSLFWVDLADTQVSDEGVQQLASCPELSSLDLAGTKVTGKGFDQLQGRELDLSLDRTAISDDGLSDVLKILSLTNLSLQETNISATAAKHLAESTLQIVELSGSTLSHEAVAMLAKAKIPDIKLDRTALDDAGLMLFAGNDDIGTLSAIETKVTAAGLQAFYEARKLRLTPLKRQESLYVVSDFLNVVDQYFPEMAMGGPLMYAGIAEPEVEGEPPQTPPGNEPNP